MDRDVIVEIRLFGGPEGAIRAYITDSDGDEVDETGSRQFSGVMVAQRLYEAVVWVNLTETERDANGKVVINAEAEPERIQAARAIRDKAGDHEGDDAFSDETWTWNGCPTIVTTWAPIVA